MSGTDVLMPEFDPSRFDSGWQRYTTAAQASHAQFMSHFNKGASPDEVAAAEQKVGCAYSPDLRHQLAMHNGGDSCCVLPGWELFSAERIVEEWKIWEDLCWNQFKPQEYDCEPDGPVHCDEWWRLKWIPFCGDGSGNHLCIDMEPDAGGTVGQVITMWHDDEARTLIAGSLTEYVEKIADDFSNGAIGWNEEWAGVFENEDSS